MAESKAVDVLLDRRFIRRITLIAGTPFALLFFLAQTFMGKSNAPDAVQWLVPAIVGSYAFAAALAFGLWFFLVRPVRREDALQDRRAREIAVRDAEPPIEFVAYLREDETLAAERAFRRASTGFRPYTMAVAVSVALFAAAVAMGAPPLAIIVLALVLLFVAVGPVLAHLARPGRAADAARLSPVRTIALRPEGLVIGIEGHEESHPWHRIREIVDAGPHFVLGGDDGGSIHIPKHGLPADALDYIRRRALLVTRVPVRWESSVS